MQKKKKEREKKSINKYFYLQYINWIMFKKPTLFIYSM